LEVPEVVREKASPSSSFSLSFSASVVKAEWGTSKVGVETGTTMVLAVVGGGASAGASSGGELESSRRVKEEEGAGKGGRVTAAAEDCNSSQRGVEGGDTFRGLRGGRGIVLVSAEPGPDEGALSWDERAIASSDPEQTEASTLEAECGGSGLVKSLEGGGAGMATVARAGSGLAGSDGREDVEAPDRGDEMGLLPPRAEEGEPMAGEMGVVVAETSEEEARTSPNPIRGGMMGDLAKIELVLGWYCSTRFFSTEKGVRTGGRLPLSSLSPPPLPGLRVIAFFVPPSMLRSPPTQRPNSPAETRASGSQARTRVARNSATSSPMPGNLAARKPLGSCRNDWKDAQEGDGSGQGFLWKSILIRTIPSDQTSAGGGR
jgi:hypothetical protein